VADVIAFQVFTHHVLTLQVWVPSLTSLSDFLIWIRVTMYVQIILETADCMNYLP
jgi:hypothetical protein